MSAAAGEERILVIATAGLARFAAALGAMATIRAHHTTAEIVLLTAPPTMSFASIAPYFNDVWSDDTRGRWDLAVILNLRRRLRLAAFDRIYDLDGDRHSAFLFWLTFGTKGWRRRAGIPWCGTLAGTAFEYSAPQAAAMHLVDRWAAQLKVAGIGAMVRPDLSWVARQVKTFTVPFRMTDPFVLLALTPGPGGDWRRFPELAAAMAAEGQRPVLIGGGDGEMPSSREAILASCPTAVDLVGRASLNDLVLLAWAAGVAVGPDNGEMHLLAAAGCRAVVLFDGASDPARVGQRGAAVTILRRPRLAQIAAGEVMAAYHAARQHDRPA